MATTTLETDITTMTATDIAALSVSQLKALTSSQWALIVASQLSELSAEKVAVLPLDFISPQALAGIATISFTSNSLAAINGLAIQKLSAAQVQALTGEQISALTAKKFANFSPEQLSLLSPDKLSAALLGELSAEQVDAFSAAQLATLLNFPSLSPEALSGLTTKNLAGVSAEKINLLNLDRLAALTPSQLNALSSELTGLSDTTLEGLSPETLKGFNANLPANVQIFTVKQIAALTPEKLAAFSIEQLQSITAPQAAVLRASQIAALPPEKATALSLVAIAAIRPQVIKHIDLSLFDGSDIAALTTRQVANFTEENIAQLTATNSVGLTSDQINSIKVKSLNALSSEAYRSLTSGAINGYNQKMTDVVDTKAPVFKSATVTENSLVMTYLDVHFLDNTTVVPVSAFTVTVNGSTNSVTAVTIDSINKIVTLTLATPVLFGQAVTLSYTDDSSTNDVNVIQDIMENDAESLSDITVQNTTSLPTTATNLSAAESYTEDTSLNLTDIVVTGADDTNITVTLTLLSPNVGGFNAATFGTVTSTFNATTGVWTASGAISDVNVLLANLIFTPSVNFNGNFTVATSVSDGIAPAITGTKSFTGTAVNDAPIGSATAILPNGTEDVAYNVSTTVLLEGFSDPEGGDLSIANLVATHGYWTPSNDGTLWTFHPQANYNGLVTLAYDVHDDNWLTSNTGNTTTFSFGGNITYHNDVVISTFSLTNPADNIKIWTDSYQNGMNFDPITALWDSTGNLIVENDDNGSISTGQSYYDSGLVIQHLPAGTYYFSIAAFNNWKKGSNLSEGFSFDGEVPIPLSQWTQPASSLNMGNYWHLNIAGVNSAGIITTANQSFTLDSANDAPFLTPTGITYTDTPLDDNFSTATGTLSATDIDSTLLTYSIEGGSGNDTTISKVGSYGTLTITPSTGAYSFVPNDTEIELLNADISESFAIIVSDGALTDIKSLTVQITQSGTTESMEDDSLIGTNGDDIISALAGNDTIDGGVGDDTITGSAGNDSMTGGDGSDVFVFAAGATGTPSPTNFEVISDWNKSDAADKIDFGSTSLTFVTSSITATTGTASIAGGIATFATADDTVAERIVAAEAGLAIGGTATAGQTVVFRQGSDSYVFISDGTDGIDENDVLVKLANRYVSSATITSGDLTVEAGMVYTAAAFNTAVAASELSASDTVYVIDTLSAVDIDKATLETNRTYLDRVILTDTSVEAATLNTVDTTLTATVIDVSDSTTVTGTASDVATAYAAATTAISGLGDEAVTLSDTSVAAADLIAIEESTTGMITASSVMTLTGTAADITTVILSQNITKATSLAITASDTMTITQANTIDAITTGIITATIDPDTAANLATLSGTGNAYTVTISDTTVTAHDLILIDAATTVAVNAIAATTITGTVADILTLLNASLAGTISLSGNESITVIDTSANIQANLADLITNSSRISVIDFNDNAEITLTAAQAVALTNKLSANDTIIVTDSLTNIQTNLSTLLADTKIDNIEVNPPISPPTFSSATVNGSSLVMTYTSDLSLSATTAVTSSFSVMVNGVTDTVTGVSVDTTAKTVVLTLASPVTHLQSVTVAYTDPTVGDDVYAIQNAIGSDAASFAAQPVVNSTPVRSGKVITDFGNTDIATSVVAQTDGKIVVTGSNGIDFALVRYNSNGSLDLNFDNDGKVTTAVSPSDESANSVAVQADGKIVVAGGFRGGAGHYDSALLRYNADGYLDTSFNSTGIVTSTDPTNANLWSSVAIQPDQKILVAGYGSNGTNDDFILARYTSSGSLDSIFGTGGKVLTDFGSYEEAQSVCIQSDGKILVFGNQNLARYNIDGSLDTSFDTDGKVSTGFTFGRSVTVQTDGKILVGGYSYNGSNMDFVLERHNSNGTVDTAFGSSGKVTTDFGYTDNAYSVVVQTDGKILVGGYSRNYPNNSFAIIRYTSTGSLDTSFDGDGKVITNVGEDPYSYGSGNILALQSDGKIILTGNSNGDFTTARYNTDGSLDTTFGM